MRLKQMTSIWQAEWRALIQTGVYWRLAAVHLVVSGIAVAVSWPASVVFDAPALPVTLNAFVYAACAVLAYAAFALSAENFSQSGKLGAIDWVYYGVATPAEVVIARLVWTGSVLISLVALSLPLAIAARALYPTPAALVAGLVTAILMTLLCCTAAGLVIGGTIAERSLRVIATDGLFTVTGIGAFLTSGWFGTPGEATSAALSPLGAIDYFLTAPATMPPPFPWTVWFGVYGLVLIALLALAYRKLWEWSPPPDWGPRELPLQRLHRQGPRRKPAKQRGGSPPGDGGVPR